MNLVIGIDYTASNGPPTDPRRYDVISCIDYGSPCSRSALCVDALRNFASLHFIDPRGPNQVCLSCLALHLYLHPVSTNTWSVFNGPQYQHAISATVAILQEYDSDKKFPVYGFGGIPPGGRDVDHCFALNLNPSNPEVAGSHGVLQVRVQSVFLHV